MKKIMLVFIVLFASMLFFSCSGEYDGSMPDNTAPKLMIYDTSDDISKKETRVQWYGNDLDGTSMTYFYCITTDTTMIEAEAKIQFTDSLWWNQTGNSYVDISMPFAAFNSDSLFMDTTIYNDTALVEPVQREIVYSKFFLYGVDEEGGETNVVSKIFGRTNKIPKHPMVNSVKLGVNGFDEYWFTIGSDSATMVLKQETSFWAPLDFRWMGEDPDGPEVDLEFSWQLCSIDTAGGEFFDVDTLTQSNGWSISYLSTTFSNVLFSNIPEGKSEGMFSFSLWVRDDAMEESENHATVNFAVFAPQLGHGILYIDDTDDSKFNSTSYLNNTGNPDGAEVNAMYEQFLLDAGYFPDYDNDPSDSLRLLQDYDMVEYSNPAPGELYQPSLKVLSDYRLVIIATEDRSKSTGIPYSSYKQQLIDYMNIGGKVMVIGHSAILMNDLYINKYEPPVRDIFNSVNPYMNADMLSFFYNYFGIYSYSTGESKTFYSEDLDTLNIPLLTDDHYLTDNYDFIGVTKYDHIDDVGIDSLRVDSAQVNKYWKDYIRNLGVDTRWEFSLKENGTVLTGIPVFEAFKGEIVLKYQSIYDLERTNYNYDISFEYNGIDTLFHNLNWYNHSADATENLSGEILQKSGAIATRYISEGDIFRTAYIGFPMVFMDNSEGKVSDLFTAMIDWFNLGDDPLIDG